MLEKIIAFCVRNKLVTSLLVATLVAAGIFSMNRIPVDAVPDITNNQVQVVTVAESLAAQEVEQFITSPLEISLSNVPNVTEIRSTSRFGLSVITVVFDEWIPILDARQYVDEQLQIAKKNIPKGMGDPELMPITTGLGEVYQYVLKVDSSYQHLYDLRKLRTIQDWIIKRQLSGIKGVVEVNSFGGKLKQYEVALNPEALNRYHVTIPDVFHALEINNENSGGSYIEKDGRAYYIRSEGLVKSLDDIRKIVVSHNNKVPILIEHLGEVRFGSPKRFGTMTKDGEGETVGGIILMLKGANSNETVALIKKRIQEIQNSLPVGVHIYAYLDRSELVGRTVNTVATNLIEGGLIVILVLLLMLGNIRAGLVVASVIPLALLFAFVMMDLFGVSANLMSLGAIDFGIVIDGAVVIVESILHQIQNKFKGQKLTLKQRNETVISSASQIYSSAAFGVLIILVVFLPIMTLSGIEGKMFRPMAYTVSFAVLGALLLSVTYVPMMTALLLPAKISDKPNFADRFMHKVQNVYERILKRVIYRPVLVLIISAALLIISVIRFGNMGSEFIPTLEEGDLAMQMTLPPGSSLEKSISIATEAEKTLRNNFPEVKHVVSKIGTAEVPTDPMSLENADIMIILKDKEEWVSATNREGLVSKMKEKLHAVEGATFEFTQPIQLRFNELLTGAKTDIAIKIFGEDLDELADQANKAAAIIKTIQGAGDVRVEQTEGLPQWLIRLKPEAIARFGLDVKTVNQTIRTAYAGENAGFVFEGEKRFDLAVRMDSASRNNIDLDRLMIRNESGALIRLSQVASFKQESGPMQISRESTKRRITIGVNVRNRDIASLVEEIKQKLERELSLKPGYYITYGGQFKNLEEARSRLIIAVPVALFLILVLLFFAFKSIKYALLIFTAVPLSAIGGIWMLSLRDMPFSISAGVGFIALFGVAVLNGIVLVSYLNSLSKKEQSIDTIVIEGSGTRLRPVLMTAAVAAFGFLPMALSTTAGGEVQRPLATVVIGGLISSTLLTLLVLPTFYRWLNRFSAQKITGILVLGLLSSYANAQEPYSLEQALNDAANNNWEVKISQLESDIMTTYKKGAIQPGKTSFSWTRGQQNTRYIDNQYQFNQSIGNIVQMVRLRKAAISGKEYKEASTKIIKQEVQMKVEKTWYNWIIENYRYEVLNNIIPVYDSLVQIAEKAKNIGAIDQLQTNVYYLQQYNWQIQYTQAKRKLNSYRNELQTLCGISDSISPPEFDPNTFISLEAFTDSDSSGIIDQYKDITQLQKQWKSDQTKAVKGNLFPNLNAGYYNQQIEGVNNFDGFRVGFSIPLFPGRTKQSSIRKELQMQQQSYAIQHELIRRKNELEMATSTIEFWIEKWINKTGDLWDRCENLDRLALLQLQKGAIDQFDFVQITKQSIETRLNMLEEIKTYYHYATTIKYLK